MKKYIFLAASALTLASCTSEDFLGNTPGNVQSNTSAINFDGGTGKITRATTQSGATAAQTLGNSYIVFGYKTAQDNSTTTTVFDHYTINWNNQAGKTESNTCGWEYVGQKANSLSKLPGDKDQTIKYWDYSASQYDFVAFSFGEVIQGEGDGKVKATAVTTTPKLSYTLTGAVNDLAKCFIADRITAKSTVETKKNNLLVAYQDNVQFNFRSLSTKVTMGIYETIPGYSVKDVKFYSSDNNKLDDAQNKPTLYAKNKNVDKLFADLHESGFVGSSDKPYHYADEDPEAFSFDSIDLEVQSFIELAKKLIDDEELVSLIERIVFDSEDYGSGPMNLRDCYDFFDRNKCNPNAEDSEHEFMCEDESDFRSVLKGTSRK